jgi:ABC-type multidrug transport system fused ATPase/permease subunit
MSPVVKILKTLWPFFSKKEKFKLFLMIVAQSMLSMLDLVGVALIGVVGSLSVNGLQNATPGTRVQWILSILNLQSRDLKFQVGVIGTLAVVSLLSRTILTIYLTRKTLRYLSSKAAQITSHLLQTSLTLNLSEIRSRPTQEFLYATTNGVNVISVGVIAPLINSVSDFAILIILSVGLFLIDPTIASVTLVLFVSIALLLYKLLHARAATLGAIEATQEIYSNQKILELLYAFREYTVRNRKFFAFKEIQESRYSLAEVNSEKAFLPNISKYVFESFLIIGSVIVAFFQFATQEPSRAAGTLSIFLATGTRITPAIMRLQQSAMMFRGALSASNSTIEMLSDSQKLQILRPDPRGVDILHDGFSPTIRIENISFRYNNAEQDTISTLDLLVRESEMISIVGGSGSGKSTLLDLILGLNQPYTGRILISGLNPLQAIERWPGAIGYVPQDVYVAPTTLRANIALGFAQEEFKDDLVWDALDQAQLSEFVRGLPHKLDTLIGEGENSLSGGQKQRIGIARALFTKPKLLILDESTSALDDKTESELMQAINVLRREVSIVFVSHRKSSLAASDSVYSMKAGKLEKKTD